MAADRVAELLDGIAAADGRMSRHVTDGVTVYETADAPFAARTGTSAEFRLRPDMAQAALRTPNTRPSDRGPEWVAFDAPAELDRYDIDRLRSWFEMAARLAGR